MHKLTWISVVLLAAIAVCAAACLAAGRCVRSEPTGACSLGRSLPRPC